MFRALVPAMDSIGPIQKGDGGKGATTLAKLVGGIRQSDVKPTHFLVVFFDYSKLMPGCMGNKKKSSTICGKVRERFFAEIDRKRFTRRFPGDDDDVTISWSSFNASSSCVYYARSRLADDVVEFLTRLQIKLAFQSILRTMGWDELEQAPFQINFITTKNLNYRVRLNEDDMSQAEDEQAMGIVGAAAEYPALPAPAAAGLALEASQPSDEEEEEEKAPSRKHARDEHEDDNDQGAKRGNHAV